MEYKYSAENEGRIGRHYLAPVQCAVHTDLFWLFAFRNILHLLQMVGIIFHDILELNHRFNLREI